MSLTPLLRRWSRRDRLAIVLVAITVAFLVGTTVVLVATGAATTEIATEFGSVGSVATYESTEVAVQHAGSDALVIPVASLEDGTVTTVVGVPHVGDRPGWIADLGLSSPSATGVAVVDPIGETPTRRGTDATVTTTLRGTEATATTTLRSRSPGLFPDDWGVARPSLVDELGSTGALVISPPSTNGASATGSPLQGAYEFFREGTTQVLAALAIVAIGVALLVAVVVFGAVRTSARARQRSIFVIRATGGTRRRVLAAFGLRGAFLSLVGVALGYAVGVIAINLAVNAGVAIGLPTSLSATVGPTAAWILLAISILAVLIGTVAGVLAARPVASRLDLAGGSSEEHAPGVAASSSDRSRVARLRERFGPRILSPRALVPMVVTLSTFVVIALLLFASASAAAPLSAGGGTIVEPGAPHPIASTVPTAYADAIEAGGGEASAEILAFSVVDGSPVMIRGAKYGAFADVTDARLTGGNRPSGPNDALVGADLARTLDLGVGDRIPVGGSTQPAVATVEVVGIYEAAGPYDDAVLVRPDVARHLTGVPQGSVQFIRTEGASTGTNRSTALTVISVDAPAVVARGTTVNVTATVLNPSASPRSQTLGLSIDGEGVQETNRSVRVSSLSSRRVSFAHTFDGPGNHTLDRHDNYTIAIDDVRRNISVVAPDTPRLSGLPATVPVGSEPQVAVRTVTDRPIANATVSVGERTYRTGADGLVRVAFPDAGDRQVVVAAKGQRIVRSVGVVRGARRTLVGSIAVSPQSPSLLTRPTARVRLSNPWNVSRTSRVTLLATGPVLRRNVTLGSGEATTVTRRLDRRGSGQYELSLRVGGELSASTNVTVRGNTRLSSALATTDASVAGGGLGAGVDMVLGNLTILAGTLVGFASVLAVGSVAFGLASSVFGRRRTLGIHRATGAGPRGVLGLLVGDGFRLAAIAVPVSIAIGIVALVGLAALDRLLFFGVRVDPVPSLPVLGAIALGSGLVVIGSVLAVGLAVVRPSPGALLTGDAAATRVGDGARRQSGVDDGARIQPGVDDGARIQPGADDGARIQPGVDDGARIQPGADDGARIQPGADDGDRLQSEVEGDG